EGELGEGRHHADGRERLHRLLERHLVLHAAAELPRAPRASVIDVEALRDAGHEIHPAPGLERAADRAGELRVRGGRAESQQGDSRASHVHRKLVSMSFADPRLTERRNPATADIDLATPLEII